MSSSGGGDHGAAHSDAQAPCRKCGLAVDAGANFCPHCGAPHKPDGDKASGTTADAPASQRSTASADEPTTELEIDADLIRYPAVLVATQGPAEGSRFELRDGRVLLGRHPESDIFLDDVTVSRRHAEVYQEGLVRRVKDMGSLNGTYLNGRRVEDAGLKNGDELQVGRFKLAYYDGTGE